MLTKEQIQKVDDSKIARVDVPEWGGHVFVKTISGFARDQYEQSLIKMKRGRADADLTNQRAKFVVMVACNEEGNLLFNPNDADWLGNKSASAIHRIYTEAVRLNGMDDEAESELKKN